MKAFYINILFAIGICVLPLFSNAQEFEDYIDVYTEGENAENYLQPLPDLLTSLFNSGFQKQLNIDSGSYFFVGLVGSMAFVSDDMRSFTGRTEAPFQPEQTTTAPTIVGDARSVTVEGQNGTAYVFPAGLNINRIPMLIPQVQIGNFFGTQATLRYFAFDPSDDFEELSFFGIGARHSISQYLKEPKFHLNVGYFYNRVESEGVFVQTQNLFSAQFGQSNELFHYYAWMGYQNASLDVDYVYEGGEMPEEISLDLENSNNVMFGLGAGLRLSIIDIGAEFNYSTHFTGSLSLGLSF